MNLVLLLPPVARTDKGDGTCYLLVVGDQLPKGNRQWLFDEPSAPSANTIPLRHVMDLPFNGESPVRDVLFLHVRHCSMVSNVEQLRTGEKALVEER